MKVAALKQKRKMLTAVIFDDGSEACLDSELVIMENIKVGSEIDDLDELLYRSDLKRAKSRALWYLSRSDHSEKALFDKLCRAEFSKRASAEAVERMKELGLINDEAYASRMAEYLKASGISKREAEVKMINRGIKRDLAHSVLEDDGDECDKIKYLLEHKYANKLSDEESVKKVFAALIRKGFSYSDVKSALKEYSEEILYSED